jgi:hypothetical protein
MTRVLRMDAPLLITALGVPVDVRLHGTRAAEARAALAPRWSLCARTAPDPGARAIDVFLGEETSRSGPTRVAGSDLAQLMVDLTHQVTFAAIDANIGTLLMLHAAGICNPATGAAVVCVAPGGTGKTTLCRTLGPGRGYLSDETVGIADDGTIATYPKPLSVRRPDGQVKDEVDPTTVGLAASTVTPYVGGILLLDRADQGPDLAQVEELDVFDAIMAMTPETSSLSRLPKPLHRLADLVESLPLVARVHYREVSTLEPVVAGLIGPAAGGTR